MTVKELDILIAEKVMGWKRVGSQHSTRPAHRPSKDYPGEIINDYDSKGPHDYLVQPGSYMDENRVAFCGCESTVEVPPFSTDIAAAWEVIEKITERPHMWQCLICHRPEDEWLAEFTIYNDKSFAAYANAAPLAICLAALKVVGYGSNGSYDAKSGDGDTSKPMAGDKT